MITHPVKILLASSIPLLFLFLPLSLRAAPSVSLSLDRTTIVVNKIFSLELTSSWEGEADEYILAPPQVTLPEGIIIQGSSFSTETKAHHYTLHYTYTLLAQKAGDYELTPIEISYWKKGDDKEAKVKTEALHFKVTPFFSFLTFGKYWLVVTVAVTFLSLFGLFIVLYRKKAKAPKSPSSRDTHLTKEMIMSELEQCNAYKIRGDWENYFKKAISIRNNLTIPDSATKIMEELDMLEERIHYGGFRPTTEEINLIQGQLEKAFKNAFPDTRDEDLEGIKFQ